METLKQKYDNLYQQIKSAGKPAAEWFPQFTPVTLLNAENWWKSLAVCEYALDTKEDEKLIESYFELIFNAFDCNVEVDLNEEEYEYWWEKVMQMCSRVSEFSGVGWAQTGLQYSEARWGKRDMSKLFPCYEKAAAMGWPEAEAAIAYWLYMGYYCEQNKEEGERRFAALSSPEAVIWGKYYRAFTEEFGGNKEKAMKMRQEMLEELPEDHRMRAFIYSCMGDALDREDADVKEVVACYEKALEYDSNLFAIKNLATIYFRYPQFNKPKQLAFDMWEKAWHAGVWSAANFLGYYYQEEEWLDIPKAIEWLEKGMLYCEMYSAYELALIYLYNEEYQNVERGLMCLERCVEEEYVDGIESLANVYFNGELVKEDMNRAKQLLEKAVELESGSAAYRLAWMYERGFLSENPDYAKAMEYYQMAASMDDEEKSGMAKFRIGLYLEKGILGEAKPEEAQACYMKAAEAGDNEGIFAVGRCYRDGVGTEQNWDKAIEWFTKGAEKNEPSCLTELGLVYERGSGMEQNPQLALEYMTRAAELGYGYAQFKMGDYYFFGFGPCLEDNKQAVEWYLKAIENEAPMAMLRMGEYYLYNYDNQNEPEKAFGYLKKAAEYEWYSEGLGICYEMGIGVEENEAEAFKYYTLAADSGNVTSMYRIGLCYYNGVGVKENLPEAYRWFKDAANNDNIGAAYYFGKMTLHGEGCAPDPETGIQWIMKAAEKDNHKAQFELGNAYLLGTGVEENDETAMEWFERAADNGNEKALRITGRRKK